MQVWAVLADWDNGRMMDNSSGNGRWWLMGLAMLIVIVAAVVLIVWLITRTSRQSAPPPGDPNLAARQILGERLARGEIEPAEYQERLSHIT